MRIKICIPLYDAPMVECLRGVKRVIDSFPKIKWMGPVFIRGPEIYRNRNHLLKPLDFDFALMLDSDVVITPEAFGEIWKRRSSHIVFGAYVNKHFPERFEAGPWDPLFPGHSKEYTPSNSRGAIEVDWAGAGCILMSSEALRKIQYPWFRLPILPSPAGGLDVLSEDRGFCFNASASGFKITLICTNKINHLKKEEPLTATPEKMNSVQQQAQRTLPRSLSKAGNQITRGVLDMVEAYEMLMVELMGERQKCDVLARKLQEQKKKIEELEAKPQPAA